MRKLLMYAAAITILLSITGCADSSMSTSDTTAPNITDPVIPTTAPDQDIPTTGPEDDPTIPDTDPDAIPSDIPQQYWAVLRNEQMIHFPNYLYHQDIFLDDYAFPHTSTIAQKLKYLEGIKYSVITTVNGEVMLAIKSTWGTLILYEKDGTVYGMSCTVKSMYFLSDNGSYCWTNTNEYGYSQLCFKDGCFRSDDLYRIVRKPEKYYIGEVEVTHDELQAYSDSYDKIETSWSDLTRYPLEVGPPLGG